MWRKKHFLKEALNPILAREGQICPTKPKTLNFGQKYNQFVKMAWWLGLGTWASISPVRDYWKNWPSVKVLDFVKDVQNVKISNLEPKKTWCFFFANVFWCYISTGNYLLTSTTESIWLFMWKRQFKHSNVKSTENISRRNKNHKTC